MEMNTDCQNLAVRFEKMAADGLVDVKFFVRSTDEATAETVCEEVNRLYEALERGEGSPLDFKDSNRLYRGWHNRPRYGVS